MLPLLKKNRDQPAASLMPAWHPNFRNFERLPDTKAVRTAFFVNGLAVCIAAGLALTLAYREYDLHSVVGATEEWQRQIDAVKPANERALANFKKFQEEEKKLQELQAFLASPVVASDFLLHLGESLPRGILLTGIDYKTTGVALRATVEGTSDKASGEAYAYVGKLRDFPAFAGLFQSVELTTINRDTASGRLVIEVTLQFKTKGKEAKK